MARRKSLTDLVNSLASFLSWSKSEVSLVYEEELGSHLVIMDSAFSMFSSIIDRENWWGGVEGAEEIGMEYEGERVLEDVKNLDILRFGWRVLVLFGVSDSIIVPESWL